MGVNRNLLHSVAILAMLASAPSPVAAQAFTLPKGIGAVTLSWQYVDNTGHRFTDGSFLAGGESVTTSMLLDVDYGVTNRLSATVGIPYVFAKYTGALPSFWRVPVDECQCWHSSFQDFSLTARYRFGNDTWAVTPIVTYGRPTHNYPHLGEAVVGRNLQEGQVGVSAGLRLVSFLPKASVQASYGYSFVQKPLSDISIDRSNGSVEFGYALKRSLYARATATWQRTHGGVRGGSPSGIPFPFPGELNTPERFAQRDQLLRSNYWHAGGGLSYSLGQVDIFASITKYISGTDTHNGQAYNVGMTWYFDRSK